MGYTMANGEFADVIDIDLAPLEGSTVTTDGNSAVVELGDRGVIALTLVVGAVSASDSLDVTVQTSRDGVNNWYSAGTFTQATTAATERKTFAVDRFVRANYNVTGSGVSITGVSLTGEAK